MTPAPGVVERLRRPLGASVPAQVAPTARILGNHAGSEAALLLYNSQLSGNCYKVRLLLAHLGVHYERREMDVVDRSGREDVLGERNPALRVPVLDLDDGRSLAESNAIIWYLGEGTEYVPHDPFDRAKALQWMFFDQEY